MGSAARPLPGRPGSPVLEHAQMSPARHAGTLRAPTPPFASRLQEYVQSTLTTMDPMSAIQDIQSRGALQVGLGREGPCPH